MFKHQQSCGVGIVFRQGLTIVGLADLELAIDQGGL